MVTYLIFVLGILALCAYIRLIKSCASCVSNGANHIDYFPAKTEAEECMILRMEDYVAQKSLTSEQPARAKAA